MRLTFPLFWICFFPMWLAAQGAFSFMPVHYREADTLVRDLNGDGHTDSLCYHYDGGSGMGGMELSLYDGREKKTYYVNTQNSKWPLYAVVHADAGLFKARNRGFLRAIERAVLPARRLERPDGALKWITDQLRYGYVYSDTGWFSLSGRFTPYDYRDPFFSYGDYFIRLDSAQVKSLIGGYHEMGGDYGEGKPFRQGWLVCYNGNMLHGISDPGKKDTVLYTNKAVISFSRGNFRYVYIDLSGDDRWGGIEEATAVGPLVFAKVRGMPGEFNLVVVDRDMGIWAKLNAGLFPYNGDYRLVPGGIRLRNGEIFLSHGDIQKRMRRLKEHWNRP